MHETAEERNRRLMRLNDDVLEYYYEIRHTSIRDYTRRSATWHISHDEIILDSSYAKDLVKYNKFNFKFK